MDIELLMNILSAEVPVPLIIENEQYVFSLIPELKDCKGFNQNNAWHIYDVYEHILKVIEYVPDNLTARFVALFPDINFGKLSDVDLDNVIDIFDLEELKLLFEIKRADLLAQNPEYHGLLKDYDKQEEIALSRKIAKCGESLF